VEDAKTPQKCYRIFFVRGKIRGSNSVSCGISGTGETPQEPLATRRKKSGSALFSPFQALEGWQMKSFFDFI